MFGNLKDFISVVQDGLSTNNNLRQKLQDVQKMKNIFRDKQKVYLESKVNYGAGGALLEKYQSDWAELHANADQNAKAADEVDKQILELQELTKSRLQSAHEMAQGLSHLPQLTAAVAQCVDSLKNVRDLLRSVEEDMVEFEDLVERNRLERWKLDHHYQLTLYKEKKMAALEETRSKLARDSTIRNAERERKQLAALQARREHSAAAFQTDLASYLTSGSVPSGSTSKPKITLEQVQLDDDPADLEKFLGS